MQEATCEPDKFCGRRAGDKFRQEPNLLPRPSAYRAQATVNTPTL